jgi:hypothetical protein
MRALGEPVVVDELGIRLLSPTLGRLVDLFGESAHGDWPCYKTSRNHHSHTRNRSSLATTSDSNCPQAGCAIDQLADNDKVGDAQGRLDEAGQAGRIRTQE